MSSAFPRRLLLPLSATPFDLTSHTTIPPHHRTAAPPHRRTTAGVDFVVANTDAQHLATCLTDNRIQMGKATTQGLGCGANPDAGKEAALESLPEIMDVLDGSHMVFITAGMGGGTGTGAAPVIAEACLDANMLTVGVATQPFTFEGKQRARLAHEGLELMQHVTGKWGLPPIPPLVTCQYRDL